MAGAKPFYAAVFGWETRTWTSAAAPATMIRVPGYGDHLEALNPGTLAAHKETARRRASRTRSAGCRPPVDARRPPPAGPSPSRVADADATAARTAELGGTVLAEPFDVPYSRMAVVRDPDGVTFTISQFQPPA